MRSTEFIKKVSKESGVGRKVVAKVVPAVWRVLKREILNGESVNVTGFARFELSKRKPYTARDPRNGNEVEVAGRYVLKYKLSQRMRDQLKELRDK